MDTLREFELKPAANGGIVVFGQQQTYGAHLDMLGAFSTPADMIAWLAEQYDITCTITVNAVVTTDDSMSGGYLVTDELCNDEGCPHHGTAHVCIDWIEWSGHSMLEDDKGLPCMIRMRNGRERPGMTFDQPNRWRWSINSDELMNDVIAYRLVPLASFAALQHDHEQRCG
jgi:hypothetical protein